MEKKEGKENSDTHHEEHHHSLRKLRRFIKKTIRVLKYVAPQKNLAILLFVITAFLSLVSLVNPYLVKILLDDVLPNKDTTLLLGLMGVFIFIFIIQSLIEIYHSYKTTMFVENVILGVKTQLFEHLENLDMSFYHAKKVGDILYRLDNDVYSIDDFTNIIVNEIVLNLLTGVFILIICLQLSWKVTVISLFFFPFYVISQKYFGDIIRKKKEVFLKKMSDLLSFLQETISSVQVINSFLLEKSKLEEYRAKTKRMIRMDIKLDLIESFSGAIVGLITFIPLLAILWYGSYIVISGALTIGSLIAIYTYIGKLFGPVSSLGSINVAIQSSLVSVNRVFEFMDIKTKIVEKPNAKELKEVKGTIEFRNVCFRYNKDEPILENISFTAKPGMVVGIAGPSGGGKTTLGNLIFRFFDATSGSILVDGIDVRDLKLASLRKNIGYVSQEAVLFNTTIRENIRMGDLKATDNEVMRAARLANIHDFVMKQPKKYDTIVGERGVLLSGGEKQRISIARVILKDPKILILDEATSSLDAESEKKIQAAFREVVKNRTTVVIAHRLSTIKDADLILVLKDHLLVETGSFEQLMKKRGVFQEYYKMMYSAPKARQ
ncbi:ABC transporter ATP-binding protein [Candidatus Woesearchaeota archaeon]|nr:ABC transporter ATP-binding protein [Candidatus Woesearchaeota archaeon]